MPRAYDAKAGERAVFDALIEARDTYGAKKPILEDQERNPLSYTDLIRAAFALGRRISLITRKGERVGVMPCTPLAARRRCSTSQPASAI